MKPYFLVYLLIFSSLSTCLSKEYIDPTFVTLTDVNFEKALVENKLDTDNLVNGQIKRTDAEAIKTLNISNQAIKSLEGIENFLNLVYLDCSFNQIVKLDVSSNLFLQSLDCSSNQIASLDCTKNMQLINLSCSNNKVKTMNISS